MEPSYLTTKEVAELIRVRERKVYDLAATGEIPHRRITGKLLFPREELLAWIEGGEVGERPGVVAGSHDPLLDWAIRESGSGLATLFNGSRDGLERFAAGEAALAGLHLPEDGGWNIASVAAQGISDAVLIGWAARQRGLLLAPGASVIDAVAGLRGQRVVLRQPGAGGAALMDRLLAEEGLTTADLTVAGSVARTENDAAQAVASGEADAALGIEAMARAFGLGFVPLLEERFDLIACRRAYFTEPVQRLVAFARSDVFAERAATLGGYDLSEAGAVRWLSA